MKFKNLFILLFIVCFACDKDDDSEDACTKTNSDFVNVSGWLQLQLESQTSNFFTDVSFLNDDFGLISNSPGRVL